MKAIFRKWVLEILRRLAQRKLKRVRPQIIGVTGSAGKTSCKEAIFEVLSRRYKVKKSEKNLNSEFGTVLTILGLSSGYSSVWGWASVLARALLDALKDTLKGAEPYDMLILEMGVDKPGDMDEILKVFAPDIMVFLNVKAVHLGEKQFANRQAVFEEKSKAALAVPKGGWVILNKDDNFVRGLAGHTPANALTIGIEEEADLRATNVEMSVAGLKFNLEYEGKSVEVVCPEVLGRSHVALILSAIAVGFIEGVPLKTIAAALNEFRLPPGRMNKIEGKGGSLILDSTYNASPDTTEAALEILGMFSGRKIAALGTMNELGELSESEHLKIGKMATEYADMLIAVGERAKELAEGAQRGGMSSSMIHTFRTSKEAGAFLANILDKHDTVLAKGSQNGVRMEHLVKLCMKNPEDARKLLVRQEPYWLRLS
ncbi:MAG: UDP-N-acetylmuramoyl-tripeptide--D-alanyl-D-alanine ligase [Candidatus Gracilibacteria bacterium]